MINGGGKGSLRWRGIPAIRPCRNHAPVSYFPGPLIRACAASYFNARSRITATMACWREGVDACFAAMEGMAMV